MDFDLVNAFLCGFDLVMSKRHGEVVAKGAQGRL